MNKGRRNELKQLKYARRLRRIGRLSHETLKNPIGVIDGIKYNFTAYKNSSNPCSCPVCSPQKYNRAKLKDAENPKVILKRLYGIQKMII